MDETARQAKAADLAEVVRLVRQGRAKIADTRGGELWVERQALRELIEAT